MPSLLKLSQDQSSSLTFTSQTCIIETLSSSFPSQGLLNDTSQQGRLTWTDTGSGTSLRSARPLSAAAVWTDSECKYSNQSHVEAISPPSLLTQLIQSGHRFYLTAVHKILTALTLGAAGITVQNTICTAPPWALCQVLNQTLRIHFIITIHCCVEVAKNLWNCEGMGTLFEDFYLMSFSLHLRGNNCILKSTLFTWHSIDFTSTSCNIKVRF